MTQPPVDDTAPCIGCGLCCDGTLFVRATVTPGEEARIATFGLELLSEDESTYFRLPCRHHCEGSCSIYDRRFDICRSFRCALLRRYQSGEIDLGEARATIAEGFRLISKATARNPALRLHAERRNRRNELAESLSKSSSQERTRAGEELLHLVALDAYLERWFKVKKDQEETVES